MKSVIIVILILLFLFSTFIVFVLIKNKFINEMASEIDKNEQNLSKKKTNFRTVISRYESLAHSETKYYNDAHKLINLNNKIQKSQENIQVFIAAFNSAKKRHKYFQCLKAYKTIKKMTISYNDLCNEFHFISEKTNSQWNQIDEISSKILFTIKNLEEYIDKNQDYLKNSSHYLLKELNTLKNEITEYEKAKTTNKIWKVNIQISDFENRIKTYIQKIDCMKKFEWYIYYHLDGLIKTMLVKYPKNKIMKDISKKYIDFKDKWLTIPYQEVTSTIKNILQNTLMVKKIEENKNNWNDFWTFEKITKFNELLNTIENYVDEVIKSSKDNYADSNKENIIHLFEKFKNDKLEIEKQISNNSQNNGEILNIFGTLHSLLLRTLALSNVMNFNKMMQELELVCEPMVDNYFWFIMSNRKILENNSVNKELFLLLNNNYANYKNETSKLLNNSNGPLYNCSDWNKLNEVLLKLLIKIEKAKMYKKMNAELTKSIINNQNSLPVFNRDRSLEILQMTANYEKNYEYDKAFDVLKSYIKKGKIDV